MNIVFYHQASGKIPVETFLNKLDPKTLARTIRNVDLLQKYGNQLGMPHVKPLGSSLFELRVRGSKEIRILFCYYKDSIVLLHAFIKKTQATPHKELELAISRINQLTSI